jgi:hypothetical protein
VYCFMVTGSCKELDICSEFKPDHLRSVYELLDWSHS